MAHYTMLLGGGSNLCMRTKQSFGPAPKGCWQPTGV